jgi:hypothetical protein
MYMLALRAIYLLSVCFAFACGNATPTNGNEPRGQLAARWSLLMQDQPATCAQLGAATVAVAIHPRSAGTDTTQDGRFAFDCIASSATTPAVIAGPYDVTLSLVTQGGETIISAPLQPNVLVSDGLITDLAPVSFAVAGSRGSLVLSLATVGQTRNCGDGGTGASYFINLHTADGECINASFARFKGGVQVGQYETDCDMRALTPCIEQDETLTADALTAGPYAISVFSTNRKTTCPRGLDVLSVPVGATAHKVVQLVTPQVGC